MFGLFGLGFFVQFVGVQMDRALGLDVTWGQPALIWRRSRLALLNLPVVIVTTEESLRAVPRETREASLALGATRWQTIRRVSCRRRCPASSRARSCRSRAARAKSRRSCSPAPRTSCRTCRRPRRTSSWSSATTFGVLATQSPDVDATKPLLYGTVLVFLLLTLLLNLTAMLLRARLRATSPGGPESGHRRSSSSARRSRTRLGRAAAARGGPGRSLPRRSRRISWRTTSTCSTARTRRLAGISLEIPARTVTAIIGPSGCGKSTFLRSFNRMNDLIPERARHRAAARVGLDVLARDTDVVDLRRRVGMVFQRSNPFPKSIFENVVFGCGCSASATAASSRCARRSSLRRGAVGRSEDRLDRSALALSGGQQQRLCIARSLAIEPEVLLMDEPASALDPTATARVEELILDLKSRYTIVVVTHNMQQAARVSDRTAFLLQGELIEYGDTRQLFTSPPQAADRGLHHRPFLADPGSHEPSLRRTRAGTQRPAAACESGRVEAIIRKAVERRSAATARSPRNVPRRPRDRPHGDGHRGALHRSARAAAATRARPAPHHVRASKIRTISSAWRPRREHRGLREDAARAGAHAPRGRPARAGEKGDRHAARVARRVRAPRRRRRARSCGATTRWTRSTAGFADLLGRMVGDPAAIEASMALVLVGRNLERIGDPPRTWRRKSCSSPRRA